MDSEIEYLISFRRAIYLNKNLTKDSIINEIDLVILRPNYGIGAENYYKVIGKKLKNDKKAFMKPLGRISKIDKCN